MSESTNSKVVEHFAAFKEWVSTIREDIETLEDIVGSDKVARDARIYLAASLNYLVTRIDLVPDWEESVGVLDDVIVLRIMIELASQHGLDEGLEDSGNIVAVGRLLNEGKRIEQFLGSELNAALRKYCVKLTDEVVRGRSCSTIVDNADQRKKLFVEIEQDLRRMPAAPFTDPEALAVTFKSHLAYKLK